MSYPRDGGGGVRRELDQKSIYAVATVSGRGAALWERWLSRTLPRTRVLTSDRPGEIRGQTGSRPRR